jgi:hypothetical protein
MTTLPPAPTATTSTNSAPNPTRLAGGDLSVVLILAVMEWWG